MIKIGVIGSRGKTKVCNIIKEKFLKIDKKVAIINSENAIQFNNENDTSDILIYVFYNEQKNLINEKIDVLVQTVFDDDNPEYFKMLQNTIKMIRKDGYIIFDSDSSEKISFYCENIYPITYGLNSKSTVTASSIDDMQEFQFSYCLQRGIYSISNEIVKPFEVPLRENGNPDEIMYYLAALTCVLIIGYKF